jgi:uncharacterized membrane protein
MKLNIGWIAKDVGNQLWFTVALYCLLGVAAALSALFTDRLIPQTISSQIGADAVDRILGIIAASMLAVATFSISTMVQAFASAATGATPRAAQLVVEDRTAQTALATFIGAFVFSLVGLIALSTGAYGSSGRLVLFIATIAVVVLIVVMLLRWIHRLSRLGRLGETIDQVERATVRAIDYRRERPCLGGHRAPSIEPIGRAVMAGKVGYVRRIDMGRLSKLAEDHTIDLCVAALPGTFATLDRKLAVIVGGREPDGEINDLAREVADCFLIGDQRSYEQDPRFGMVVLSEIASRALSPAVNDPGTAIDVIGTMVRVLSCWAKVADRPSEEIKYPRIFVPAITARDLLDDGVAPIARDGAALVEVGIRLQKAMRALAHLGDAEMAEAAREHARLALARGEQELGFAPDRDRLVKAAEGRE